MSPPIAANENYPPSPAGRMVPIVGRVGPGDVVTITDPTWHPTPRAGGCLVVVLGDD